MADDKEEPPRGVGKRSGREKSHFPSIIHGARCQGQGLDISVDTTSHLPPRAFVRLGGGEMDTDRDTQRVRASDKRRERAKERKQERGRLSDGVAWHVAAANMNMAACLALPRLTSHRMHA